MERPEKELTGILREAGVDFTSSLPCEKIKTLLEIVSGEFFHVPLTREEEGVGICAGAALAGRRPAIFVQSSGIGNMINALLSLTQFYELPLAVFVSQRGVYKEKIAAQFPMGQRLPRILRAAGIPFSVIGSRSDFALVKRKLPLVYAKGRIHAFLLSPAVWEGSCDALERQLDQRPVASCRLPESAEESASPEFSRYGILELLAPWLGGRAVACNLGIPSKELYAIRHQTSNFYMLGSMGMVTPIALGMSLSVKTDVVAIDGDGSLLMNPGVLATAAHCGPENLTILAIDNSSYGSTGSQRTLTGSCVDLAAVARGFGIVNTVKAGSRKQLLMAVSLAGKGPRFIHALALPGNAHVPNIPLHHLENRNQMQEFLRGKAC